MENEFTDFLNYFNDPLNQSEYFEKKTPIDTVVGDLIFKDSGMHPDSSYPVGEISETISLPVAGTLNSKYEPIGEDVISFATITPMFEKTTSDISYAQMKYYEKIMNNGKQYFINQQMEKHTKALRLYCENQKNMALTGEVVSYFRTNEGEIKGKSEYSVASNITNVDNSTFGIDLSTANMTRTRVFNKLEKQRKIAYKATGLFAKPSDVVILMSDTNYMYMSEILDVSKSDNNISKINPSFLVMQGYTFVNESGTYKKPILNETTGKYVMTEYNAVGAKEMLMIDNVGSNNKFRFLDPSDMSGTSAGQDYYLKMVMNDDDSGAKIYFRAVPLAIINGYSIIKIAGQA